jgi:transcription antitermination factor NusG
MWYAVYTKPKREASVAFQLQNIGIEVLNPKLRSRRYRRNRFIEVIEPLFSCYIFANFEKDNYFHLITYTRGVRYIVGKKNPVIVPVEVIKAIKESMGEDNIIVVKPRTFKKGDRVIIREGPFKDFCGIFEREIKSCERVMLLLSTLNYKIELERCFLAVA